VARPLYLDTSALLRVTLESGTTPEMEKRLTSAERVVTSRLSVVEAARALLRTRLRLDFPETRLADIERQIEAVFRRCEIWELTPAICELACRVAPRTNLRALDALHLATFLNARRRLEDLEILTADSRLQDAAAGA
jgi:predicted nucleic acid-binding protein